MSTETDSTDTGIATSHGDDVTEEFLREEGDLQAQSAREVAAEFDTTAELIEFDEDWEEIKMVGPASAGKLDALVAEVKEDLESSVGPAEPEIDEEEASESVSEEETDDEVSESDDSAEDSDDSHEDDAEDGASADTADSEATEEEEDGEPRRVVEQLRPQVFDVEINQRNLRNLLYSVKKVVDETRLFVYGDRIEIRAVDPANVSMVDITVGKEGFESWQAEPGVIGINVDRLLEIVKVGDKDDVVSLTLGDKLTVSINGLEYDLATIEPTTIRKAPDLPEVELPGEVTLEGDALDRAVTAADMVSDHIEIRMNESEEALIFAAEGDTDDVELTLSEDKDGVSDLTAADVDSLFALDYLKDINRASEKALEDLRIRLGDEMPLRVHSELEDGIGEVQGMLAPRIQSG
jgi:proliferating cell nuclear antigen